MFISLLKSSTQFISFINIEVESLIQQIIVSGLNSHKLNKGLSVRIERSQGTWLCQKYDAITIVMRRVIEIILCGCQVFSNYGAPLPPPHATHSDTLLPRIFAVFRSYFK